MLCVSRALTRMWLLLNRLVIGTLSLTGSSAGVIRKWSIVGIWCRTVAPCPGAVASRRVWGALASGADLILLQEYG